MNESIISEIQRQALLFCVDNERLAGELTAIETAMLIGASIAYKDMGNILGQRLPPSKGAVRDPATA